MHPYFVSLLTLDMLPTFTIASIQQRSIKPTLCPSFEHKKTRIKIRYYITF